MFIPRREPARNQHPSSLDFDSLPQAALGGPDLQSRYSKEWQAVTFPPCGPLRAAPGENPCGNQKPGTNTGHSLRHGSHVQSRSSGPYVIPDHEHLLVTYSSLRIAPPALAHLRQATKCQAPGKLSVILASTTARGAKLVNPFNSPRLPILPPIYPVRVAVAGPGGYTCTAAGFAH